MKLRACASWLQLTDHSFLASLSTVTTILHLPQENSEQVPSQQPVMMAVKLSVNSLSPAGLVFLCHPTASSKADRKQMYSFVTLSHILNNCFISHILSFWFKLYHIFIILFLFVFHFYEVCPLYLNFRKCPAGLEHFSDVTRVEVYAQT